MASQKFWKGRWLLQERSGGWILGDPIPRKIRSVYRGSRCVSPNTNTFRSVVLVVVGVVFVRGCWVLSFRWWWWKAERRRGRGVQSQSLLPPGSQLDISRMILASPLSLCEMPLQIKSNQIKSCVQFIQFESLSE